MTVLLSRWLVRWSEHPTNDQARLRGIDRAQRPSFLWNFACVRGRQWRSRPGLYRFGNNGYAGISNLRALGENGFMS
jgi:hypothetical protein